MGEAASLAALGTIGCAATGQLGASVANFSATTTAGLVCATIGTLVSGYQFARRCLENGHERNPINAPERLGDREIAR